MKYNSSYFTDICTLEREVYVDDKSSYQPYGDEFKGYKKVIKSVSTEDFGNGKLGLSYTLTTFIDIDIKNGDVVTINGEKFNVQDTGKKNGRIVKYTYCILDKKD